MRSWVGLLVIGVLLATAAGIGLILIATSSSTTALLDLEIGDCFDLPDASDRRTGGVDVVETVEVVPCDRPHGAEVVGGGQLNPDGGLDYPPDDELFALIDERCLTIDGPPIDRFGVVPIAPTEQSWTTFDGRFLCLAIPYGTVTTTGRAADG